MIKKRIDFLDSLRGIAALSVALFHFILFYKKQVVNGEIDFFSLTLYESFTGWVDLGKIAVVIFFMISGFVIPYSIKGEGINALKKFAISRFFRLYPVYWLSVVLGFLLLKDGKVLDAIINLTMMQQFVGVPNVIGLYWTLQLELIFYFLFGLLLLIKFNENNKLLFGISLLFLLVGVVMAVFRYILNIKLPLAIPLGLSSMFFGSYWRNYIVEKNLLCKKYSIIYLIVFFIIIPFISFFGYNVDFGFHESWQRYLITYYSAIVIFILFNFIKLHNRVLTYLGAISYSIYLFHPIIFKWFNPLLLRLGLPVIINILILLVIVVIFSSGTYKVIEMPFVQIGKKLRSRL